MTDVAVGKHNLVDAFLTTQAGEFGFIPNRYAIRVVRSGEGGRITPSGNFGNLCCSECDHLTVGIIAIRYIEIMEVTSGSPHYYDAIFIVPARHNPILFCLLQTL
ncbi:MAG: hypothetical protein PVH46_10560, partial [Granulosicoccaceae bacterium]